VSRHREDPRRERRRNANRRQIHERIRENMHAREAHRPNETPDPGREPVDEERGAS